MMRRMRGRVRRRVRGRMSERMRRRVRGRMVGWMRRRIRLLMIIVSEVILIKIYLKS